MSMTADSAVARPPISAQLKYAFAWLIASLVGVIVALAHSGTSVMDGEYVPVGPDSFYHARRILDALTGPFYQFDPLMHVPEGGLIIWPWAYDYVMSLFVRVGMALHLADNPLSLLVHVPVVAFPIAMLIMLGLARGLQLNVWSTALAMLGVALFPLNQSLYGIGNLDHHFAENLFVLGSLLAGFAWLKQPESKARAITLGLVLAAAPGVHTALFILQVPLLLAVILMWARGEQLPRTTLHFAIALIAGSLAIAAPSLALREGRFEFQTLSWFQPYAALCTSVVIVLVSRLAVSRRNIAFIAATSVVLLIPILASQLALASDFFNSSLEGTEDISETISVWQQWQESGRYLAYTYSGLVFLAPFTLALCVYLLWREKNAARSLVWIASIAGIVLLLAQLRLHYFGSFALLLPWIFVADKSKQALAVATGVFFVAFAPGVFGYLFQQQAPSGDATYAVTRQVYAPFANACAQHPGSVALANPSDGHYIRFHTKCAVIANNFMLTLQQAAKVREERALLNLSLAQVMEKAPQVRIIYARRDTLFYVTPQGTLEFAPHEDASHPDQPLVRELLQADPEKLPANVKMVYQLMAPPPDAVAVARVFEIQPSH